MQYLMMLYADESGWNALTEAQQREGVAAYGAYTEALSRAGVLVGRNRLESVSSATTVTLVDGKSRVLDGPYLDSKEQLGGYYLIDVANLDDAIAWAARCPAASHGTIEVRPVFQTCGSTVDA